ncbi:MAG TPA: hypothetical protein PKA83_14885 [Pirellulaceae bacterium]|nr:hypothetical protein [Pirellulaceae bacterium]
MKSRLLWLIDGWEVLAKNWIVGIFAVNLSDIELGLATKLAS